MASLEMQSSGKKHSLVLRLSAWAGIVGPILFILVLTLDGFLRPGYSPIHQRGSDLGVGWANAWIFTLDLAIFGLLLIAFTISFSQKMWPLISKRRLTASIILLVIAGIGALIAGFFSEEAPLMHALGANLLFLLPVIVQFMIGLKLRTISAWRGYGRYSLINGVVAFMLACFGNLYPILKLLPSMMPVVTIMSTQIGGLYQRITLIAIFSWYVVTGCRFLALERERSQDTIHEKS